jgi:hypothetical protein
MTPNTLAPEQRVLSSERIEAFHHDLFVEDQVRHFSSLTKRLPRIGVVADVGGGCGYFARRVIDALGLKVRVLDLDERSLEICSKHGVETLAADALDPRITGDEEVVCFNLILHHLIGRNEQETRSLQSRAISVWSGHTKAIFVNEYIYESYLGNLSGRLIYQITSSRILSWIAARVAAFVPSFRANTFGIGVRFRAHNEWKRLFQEAGFDVAQTEFGPSERIAAPRRLLLIKAVRRDSFLLLPRSASSESA